MSKVTVGAHVAPLPGSKPSNVRPSTAEKVGPILEGHIGEVRKLAYGGECALVKFRGNRALLQYRLDELAVQTELSLGGVRIFLDETVPDGKMQLDTGAAIYDMDFGGGNAGDPQPTPRPVSYGAAYSDLRTAILGVASVLQRMGNVVAIESAPAERAYRESLRDDWNRTIAAVVQPLLAEDAPSDAIKAPQSDERDEKV